MSNRLFIAGVIILSALTFNACCKKRNYCTNQPLKVYFTGFDRGSTRTVLLKKYALTDKTHTKALDSSQLVYNGTTPIVVNKKDTVFLGDYVTVSGALTGIYPGNDWAIILPGSGNYYTISTVLDDDHRYEIIPCKDKTSTCSLSITHYSINGGYHDGDAAYISR